MERLMTEKEKELARRNSAIRAEYARMREKFTEASDWRICSELARKYRLSTMTIRKLTK